MIIMANFSLPPQKTSGTMVGIVKCHFKFPELSQRAQLIWKDLQNYFSAKTFLPPLIPKTALFGMGYRMGYLRLKNSFQFNFLSITFLYFSYFVMFCIFIAKRPHITLWFSFTVIFIIICINRVAVQFFLFTSRVRKLNLICYS